MQSYGPSGARLCVGDLKGVALQRVSGEVRPCDPPRTASPAVLHPHGTPVEFPGLSLLVLYRLGDTHGEKAKKFH